MPINEKSSIFGIKIRKLGMASIPSNCSMYTGRLGTGRNILSEEEGEESMIKLWTVSSVRVVSRTEKKENRSAAEQTKGTTEK